MMMMMMMMTCRIMSLAQDYCVRRSVFGKLLRDHPLHMQTLARLEVLIVFQAAPVYFYFLVFNEFIHFFNIVSGRGNASARNCLQRETT